MARTAGNRLLCCLDGGRHEVPEEDFYRLELAYAITVHKAQGSQFDRVIVPVFESLLLDRTLIYTAMTRGVEQVVFIGDGRAFEAAVAAAPSATVGRSPPVERRWRAESRCWINFQQRRLLDKQEN